jgi:microcystin-dependent protein
MITVKCFPLAGTQNYAVEDFQYWLGSRVAGVFTAGDNLKVEAQASPDMSVRVLSGLAWLEAGTLRGVSFPLTEAGNVTIEAADALEARVDAIVVGLDKVTRSGYIKAVKGLLGGVAPSPTRDASVYELVLAHVSVPAGTTSILAANITDKRADETICGLMRNDIEGVVNNLTTDDASKVLSAAMGKSLQDNKAPKASPTFTGTATIPTAAVSTLNASAVYSPSFVGMVAFFAGTNTPAGWLKCDGTEVSKTTYANLYAFIGDAYATGGEGAGNFRLPNLCDGSFIRGVGGNADAIGAKQADEVKSHTHSISMLSTAAGVKPIGSGSYAGTVASTTGQYGGSETRPLNTAMTPFIKF